MTVDISPLLQAAVGLAALVIVAVAPYVAARAAQLIGLKISAQQMASFDGMITKAAQAGAVWVEAEAAQKGWDHPDVTKSGVALSLQYAIQHFPGAIKAMGLDPNNPADAMKIQNAIARQFPIVAGAIAASPMTTNGPPAIPVSTAATPVPAATAAAA